MRQNRVFVYGTLMRGHRNYFMMEGAEFIGLGRTREAAFVMRQNPSKSSPGNFTPGVRDEGSAHIAGEIFLVSDDHLAALDEFEDVGVEYTRKSIILEDGTEAGIYLVIAEKPSCAPGDPEFVEHDVGQNTYHWRAA